MWVACETTHPPLLWKCHVLVAKPQIQIHSPCFRLFWYCLRRNLFVIHSPLSCNVHNHQIYTKLSPCLSTIFQKIVFYINQFLPHIQIIKYSTHKPIKFLSISTTHFSKNAIHYTIFFSIMVDKQAHKLT